MMQYPHAYFDSDFEKTFHVYFRKIIEVCFPKQNRCRPCLLFQQNQHQKISEKLNAISALRVRFNPFVRYNEDTEEVLR